MLQLFLKTSNISAEDWAIVYQKIGDLVTAFPLKLIRIESYNGYESNQDKDHLNLRVNSGMEDEHLAFYGDFISWTSGTTICFYKNWEKHREESIENKKILILQQLKKKRSIVTIGIGFEHWLLEEMDENVLLCLRLLLSLKIYDRSRAYARYRILHDRELWQHWREMA